MLPCGNTFSLFLAHLVLVVHCFSSVMEDIKKILDGLEKSVRLLQDQMDSIKKASKVPVSGEKSPEERPPSVREGDKVHIWLDRMEFETEALTQSGSKIHPVKVCEEIDFFFRGHLPLWRTRTIRHCNANFWFWTFQSLWFRSWTKSWVLNAFLRSG